MAADAEPLRPRDCPAHAPLVVFYSAPEEPTLRLGLREILDVIGTPNVERDLRHVPEKARRYIAGLPPSQGKTLHSIYPNASEEAINLLREYA